MEVLEIRPARVSAALVAIGDMLVSSPIGENGPRPSRWIGAVTEHVIVEEHEGRKVTPGEWRQWRLGLVDGRNTETAVIPADGWVWVHLPIVGGPIGPVPAGMALAATMMDVAEQKDAELRELLDGESAHNRHYGASPYCEHGVRPPCESCKIEFGDEMHHKSDHGAPERYIDPDGGSNNVGDLGEGR